MVSPPPGDLKRIAPDSDRHASGNSGLDSEEADVWDRTEGRAGLALQHRPRHVLAGELRCAVGKRVSAAGTMRYMGDQVYETRRGPLLQADLPDSPLVGLRLEQRIGPGPLAAYLGVDNLLDEAYEQSYGFPQPGRMVYLGLDWRSR